MRQFTFSKIFSVSETAWPIKAKFYVEHPWVGGTFFMLIGLELWLLWQLEVSIDLNGEIVIFRCQAGDI